jgi:hydroxymethylpyrimidine pyrophosphatase-like HAD family hydrolase
MIKLFVLDIDGCISFPFKTPDWEAVNKIRELNIRSRSEEHIPPVTLCTGRPLPYAEAVAQWLDVRLPFVFESAGLFKWEGNEVITSPEVTHENLKRINTIREWLRTDLLPDYDGVELEFSKMMDAGVVSANTVAIDDIHAKVLDKIRQDQLNLEVHNTEVSVNILLPGNNKGTGIRLIAAQTGIALREMAYIGDSSGDVPALKEVAMPFAPANGTATVRAISDVMPSKATHAVLEAYQKIIDYNKSIG